MDRATDDRPQTGQGVSRHVKLIVNKTSLGDPVTRITARRPEEDRGIPVRYTRVSIGLEDPEDIIADFNLYPAVQLLRS